MWQGVLARVSFNAGYLRQFREDLPEDERRAAAGELRTRGEWRRVEHAPRKLSIDVLPGVVFKRVRDLDVIILGRAVWRATDDKDPLVCSLREIRDSVHIPGG